MNNFKKIKKRERKQKHLKVMEDLNANNELYNLINGRANRKKVLIEKRSYQLAFEEWLFDTLSKCTFQHGINSCWFNINNLLHFKEPTDVKVIVEKILEYTPSSKHIYINPSRLFLDEFSNTQPEGKFAWFNFNKNDGIENFNHYEMQKCARHLLNTLNKSGKFVKTVNIFNIYIETNNK